MTKEQAEALAREQWKERAHVQQLSTRYEVGKLEWGRFTVVGSGDSWEEACRKAGLL